MNTHTSAPMAETASHALHAIKIAAHFKIYVHFFWEQQFLWKQVIKSYFSLTVARRQKSVSENIQLDIK